MTEPHFACFVTGTDTEVGKTLISCALLHALREQGMQAVAMKPVAAGASQINGVWHNDDVDALAQHASVPVPLDVISPFLLRTACAPHIAAMREQQTICLPPILHAWQQLQGYGNAQVVEGVGGFCVPFAPGLDSADLAQTLGLPVILVVGMRLGCLNHALLTCQAIAARGLRLAGWVANVIDDRMPYLADNIAALVERIDAPLLGCVPHLATPSAALAASCLDRQLLLNMLKPSTPSTPSTPSEPSNLSDLPSFQSGKTHV